MLAGLQRFEVIFQEDPQVLIMKLLQPPLRPEEGFKVVQRSVGSFHDEGVAPCQALLEEAVNLGVPASLQFAQGFDIQHLCCLIGHFSDLVVDRFR